MALRKKIVYCRHLRGNAIPSGHEYVKLVHPYGGEVPYHVYTRVGEYLAAYVIPAVKERKAYRAHSSL